MPHSGVGLLLFVQLPCIAGAAAGKNPEKEVRFMEKREVTIGGIIYEVGRSFVGSQPVEELVLDRLLHQAGLAEPDFDLRAENAV